MRRVLVASAAALLLCLSALSANAQPLVKSAIQVDAGNTKPTGQTFGYRLTYNCSSTSGPCLNAEVVDLLPAEVQLLSTVPASPTGDVAAINVTPNFMGSGRTRVQFVMINPLPAGNSGDLLINVRFPNGSTPNGTVATNTADGINLGATARDLHDAAGQCHRRRHGPGRPPEDAADAARPTSTCRRPTACASRCPATRAR